MSDDAEAIVYEIDEMGGNCPVQASGTIGPDRHDGKPLDWFFRARGNGWSFTVYDLTRAGESLPKPRFDVGGRWGSNTYASGWMSEEDALALIAQSVELYRLQEKQSGADDARRSEQVRSGKHPEAADRDDCSRCKGERGGVKGNENVLDGELVCDYCHADALANNPNAG